MAQVELRKDELRQLGAQLVYIAAEKRNGLWKPANYFAAHPVSFPFLLDEDCSVTKAYGLYHRLSRDAFRIAHPATLVVNRNGQIEFIYRGEGQRDRVSMAEITSVLRDLNPAPVDDVTERPRQP
jgi:peroxiredoxin